MFLSSNEMTQSDADRARLRQLARINSIIASGGHKAEDTSLIEREYEETDIM